MIAGDTAAEEVATAAHDLNNLCARLMGFSALALEAAPPESELSTYLAEIGDAAERTTVLAAQLHAIARRLLAATGQP